MLTKRLKNPTERKLPRQALSAACRLFSCERLIESITDEKKAAKPESVPAADQTDSIKRPSTAARGGRFRLSFLNVSILDNFSSSGAVRTIQKVQRFDTQPDDMACI